MMLVLTLSVYGFNKSVAVTVDNELIEFPTGEMMMVSYYCWEKKLYVVMKNDETNLTSETTLPVVWYIEESIRGHVDCVDYDKWQEFNNR